VLKIRSPSASLSKSEVWAFSKPVSNPWHNELTSSFNDDDDKLDAPKMAGGDLSVDDGIALKLGSDGEC
jgi:hypothetical protein